MKREIEIILNLYAKYFPEDVEGRIEIVRAKDLSKKERNLVLSKYIQNILPKANKKEKTILLYILKKLQ